MFDVLCKNSTALPNGAATTTSAALDLQGGGKYTAGKCSLTIAIPATPALANAATMTVGITHCATSGGSYVAVPGYGGMITTGAGGAGAAAVTYTLPLHENVLQFVKVTFTGSAAGDSSGVSAVSGLTIP